jgi:soluble lytic murein transglycosylase-like protein
VHPKAIFANVAVGFATLWVGSLCGAQAGSAPSPAAARTNAGTLEAETQRLNAASAGHIASAAPNSDGAMDALEGARCRDGAVAPEAVRKMIADEARRQGVDIKLALAIGGQESNFGAQVNSAAASISGAAGVMQLMPETAIRYRVADRCEATENVRGGVSFIKDLSEQFGGNVFLILAAYNAGEKRVYAAKGVPPISETVRYVASAANAYYDFPNALNSVRRAIAVDAQAPAPSPSEPQADSVGQKWIGGSVLYVEQEK